MGGIKNYKAKFFFELIGSSLENYTSNNTRQHDTTQDNTSTTRHNTRQHKYNTRQQETTRLQHETTRVQQETTRVRNNIEFTLICLYHRCILGAWYIKL